jgi:hypothetical protein
MQGIEYLLWQHQECDAIHRGLSIAGMALNHAQPIVLGVATAWVFGRNIPALFAIMAAYLAVAIPYSAQYLTDDQLQCTQPRCGNPHLVWRWNRLRAADWMYAVFIAAFMAIAFVGFPSWTHAALFSAMTVLTFGTSYLIYPRESVGALWCFWASFVPLVLAVIARQN